MRISLGAAGAMAAILAAAFASPCLGAPPAEVFGNLPLIETGRLSPDGKHLATIQPVGGRDIAAIYDLTSASAPPRMVTLESAVASNVYWPNNDRLICVFKANLKQKFSKDIYAWSRAVSVTPDGQNAVLLMHDQPFLKYNFGGAAVVEITREDPNSVYMEASENAEMSDHSAVIWDATSLSLYKVNVATGTADIIYHGTPQTIQILMDGHGHVVGRVEQDSSLKNHVIIGGKEVAGYDAKGGSSISIEGLTMGDSPNYAVAANSASGQTGLYNWNAAGGVGSALFVDGKYDMTDTIEDEATGRIVGVSYVDDRPRSRYFDPKLQHVQSMLEAAFPGQSVTITSKDDAGNTYVILTEGPRNPPVLSLFTSQNHQVNTIQEAYPALHPSDLGEMKQYAYTARDGTAIDAYLTLPPGKTPHNLPTIIFPHGGPEARDMLQFDWWAQFMATRGYAVLQPNFRGSSGYGWDFVKAGDGEWAGKVQYDVQDGVKKLIADGIADPKRICIVGASYGGYMALAGATFSPDLYRCAVSYAGLSDLAHDIYRGTTFESESVSIWKRRMGADVDSAKLDAQSPAMHADQVKIPILLIHSEKDVTVPIEQSEIEEKALKQAGKSVEFVRLAGDDHYLQLADARIRMLKELERFLSAHIGN
jgi:acetyl esterase/lipase